jgi:F0F1-type ATP synthase assembly protein I
LQSLQPTPSPVDQDDARAAGVAAGLGCSIVVSIIFCIVGGVFLDRWLDTSPWFTLGGVALGLFVAAYQLYELAMMGNKGEEPRIMTRQIVKVTGRIGKPPEQGDSG